MSGILRYFHLVKDPSSSKAAGLPDPNGPLSKVIPSSTIAAANEKVCAIGKTGAVSKMPYLHLTAAQKYQVGKRAAEFGTTNTIRYYARRFPGIPLKETSVRRFKSQYHAESVERSETE